MLLVWCPLSLFLARSVHQSWKKSVGNCRVMWQQLFHRQHLFHNGCTLLCSCCMLATHLAWCTLTIALVVEVHYWYGTTTFQKLNVFLATWRAGHWRARLWEPILTSGSGLLIRLLLIIADNLIRQRKRRIRKDKYERINKDRQLKTKPTPKPSTKKNTMSGKG